MGERTRGNGQVGSSAVPEKSSGGRIDLLAYYQSSRGYLERLQRRGPHSHKYYLNLIRRFAGQGALVLDLGCGIGSSSMLIANSGYTCYGLDCSHLFLTQATLDAKKRRIPVQFLSGDICTLPFAEEVFDVVASHASLEHVTQPEEALQEMIRVVKPGGHIVIVGPNLLSPTAPVKALWNNLVRDEPLSHPLFGTRWEAVQAVVYGILTIRHKGLDREITFLRREPIVGSEADIGCDLDAAYLMTPIDLVRYFRRLGFDVHNPSIPTSLLGCVMARFLPNYAGGVGVVAQKPSQR